jgi:hypothetical protein
MVTGESLARRILASREIRAPRAGDPVPRSRRGPAKLDWTLIGLVASSLVIAALAIVGAVTVGAVLAALALDMTR